MAAGRGKRFFGSSGGTTSCSRRARSGGRSPPYYAVHLNMVGSVGSEPDRTMRRGVPLRRASVPARLKKVVRGRTTYEEWPSRSAHRNNMDGVLPLSRGMREPSGTRVSPQRPPGLPALFRHLSFLSTVVDSLVSFLGVLRASAGHILLRLFLSPEHARLYDPS